MKKYYQAHICFVEESDYRRYMEEIRRFRKVSKSLGRNWKKELIRILKKFNDEHEKPEILRPKKVS